jgi:hypothetical protein
MEGSFHDARPSASPVEISGCQSRVPSGKVRPTFWSHVIDIADLWRI